MAYMSVMKGLDEKAKRKDVDGVFMRLDKNQNGLINLALMLKVFYNLHLQGKSTLMILLMTSMTRVIKSPRKKEISL